MSRHILIIKKEKKDGQSIYLSEEREHHMWHSHGKVLHNTLNEPDYTQIR